MLWKTLLQVISTRFLSHKNQITSLKKKKKDKPEESEIKVKKKNEFFKVFDLEHRETVVVFVSIRDLFSL